MLRRMERPFSARLLVVAGQCRKVGKTRLIEDILRAFPETDWTCVKITPYSEMHCPVNGPGCRCGPDEHPFAIREEADRSGRSDTSRYLKAGAKTAIWVETKPGHFERSLKPLAENLRRAEWVIIESGTLLKFWRPSVSLLVVNPRRAEMKTSAHSVSNWIDGVVFRSPDFSGWLRGRNQKHAELQGQSSFLHPFCGSFPAQLKQFLRQRYFGPRHQSGKARGVFSVDRA